jgi:hypothetical protein
VLIVGAGGGTKMRTKWNSVKEFFGEIMGPMWGGFAFVWVPCTLLAELHIEHPFGMVISFWFFYLMHLRWKEQCKEDEKRWDDRVKHE